MSRNGQKGPGFAAWAFFLSPRDHLKTPMVLALFLLLLAGCSRGPDYYVEVGNRQLAEGKLQDAKLSYRKALQADEKNAEAFYRLGLLHLQEKKGLDAYQALTRAVELRPDHKDALQKLGDLALLAYVADPRRPEPLQASVQKVAGQLLKLDANSFDGNRFSGHLALWGNRPAEAVSFFEKADRSKPNDPELRLMLAQALIQEGKAAEGEAMVRQLIASKPDFERGYEYLFRRFVLAGKLPDAESVLVQRASNIPGNGENFAQLAAFYAATNQQPKAVEVMRQLTSDRARFPDGLLVAGDYEAKHGNYQAAAEHYAKGAQQSGGSQNLCRKKYAGTLVLLGRRQEASDLLGKLKKDLPNDRDVRSAEAYLLLESGTPDNVKQAVAEIRTLIEEKDDQSALHFHLGRALAAAGDTVAARQEWVRAVQLDGADLRPRLALARLSLAIGDPSGAFRQLDELASLFIGNPEVALLRVSALQSLARLPEARKALAALQAKHPGNHAVEMQHASLLLAEDRIGEAEKAYRKLYRVGDPNPGPLLGLAQALVLQGNRDAAVTLLEKDLQSVPGRPDVQVALARGYLVTGRAEKARALLESAVASPVPSASLRRALADLNVHEGKYDLAIPILTELTKSNPVDTELLAYLGEVRHAADQLPEAEKDLREALKRAPDSRRARLSLALLLADTGQKLDEAMELAHVELRKEASDLAARDAIGYIYLKQKKTDVALATLQGLSQKNPREAIYRYHYGLALRESGNAEKSRDELQAALSLNPPPALAAKIKQAMP